MMVYRIWCLRCTGWLGAGGPVIFSHDASCFMKMIWQWEVGTFKAVSESGNSISSFILSRFFLVCNPRFGRGVGQPKMYFGQETLEGSNRWEWGSQQQAALLWGLIPPSSQTPEAVRTCRASLLGLQDLKLSACGFCKLFFGCNMAESI